MDNNYSEDDDQQVAAEAALYNFDHQKPNATTSYNVTVEDALRYIGFNFGSPTGGSSDEDWQDRIRRQWPVYFQRNQEVITRSDDDDTSTSSIQRKTSIPPLLSSSSHYRGGISSLSINNSLLEDIAELDQLVASTVCSESSDEIQWYSLMDDDDDESEDSTLDPGRCRDPQAASMEESYPIQKQKKKRRFRLVGFLFFNKQRRSGNNYSQTTPPRRTRKIYKLFFPMFGIRNRKQRATSVAEEQLDDVSMLVRFLSQHESDSEISELWLI